MFNGFKFDLFAATREPALEKASSDDALVEGILKIDDANFAMLGNSCK